MPSRPPLRRTTEDIVPVEMQPHTSFTNPHPTLGSTVGLADQEKDPSAGFDITDSIGSGSNSKFEEAQYGEVRPIQGYSPGTAESSPDPYADDPFGNEEGNKLKYKTLTWWYV